MKSVRFRPPRIEVICVGSELLTSRVNSHTVAIGQMLARIGLSITRGHVVGDDVATMREIFSEALRRADVVLCAGGLGPTFDDLTREIWARVTGHPLRFHPDLLVDIRAKFRARGLSMPPRNRQQAFAMKDAHVLNNPLGTAPGQLLRAGKKILALLPGPTRELVPMFENAVLPELRSSFPNLFIAQKAFLIFGMSESRIDQMIRPWVAKNQRVDGCVVEHGILASNAIITVKLKVSGANEQTVLAVRDALAAQARRRLSAYIFGEDNDTLDSVVTHELKRQKKMIAVAESCTGGLIAKTLTDAAGASDIFLEGVVTYHNSSKRKRLGVAAKTLLDHGAVSEQTALEMARGVKRTSGADIGVSVTGIAGPTGGTTDKPIGLVWIGIADDRGAKAHEFRFAGDRATIRQRSAQNVFNLLRKELTRGR
jgi:nicotinamide-nucleotide amidase